MRANRLGPEKKGLRMENLGSGWRVQAIVRARLGTTRTVGSILACVVAALAAAISPVRLGTRCMLKGSSRGNKDKGHSRGNQGAAVSFMIASESQRQGLVRAA
jgi:hypothetical protein